MPQSATTDPSSMRDVPVGMMVVTPAGLIDTTFTEYTQGNWPHAKK
jgi:hypothetical protein